MRRPRHAADRALDRLLGPTPEQRAMNVYAEVNPATIDSAEQPIGRALRNLTGTPLDRYRQRGHVDERQWRAGDRLRTDWQVAALNPRVVQAYAPALGGGGDPAWQLPASERQALARERWRRTLAALPAGLGRLLVEVACHEATAQQIGARLGRSGRNAEIAGMTALRLALDALADHYGL